MPIAEASGRRRLRPQAASAGLGRQREGQLGSGVPSAQTVQKLLGSNCIRLASPPALRLALLSALYIHAQCARSARSTEVLKKHRPCSPDTYLLRTYYMYQCELQTPRNHGTHAHAFVNTHSLIHPCTHSHMCSLVCTLAHILTHPCTHTSRYNTA